MSDLDDFRAQKDEYFRTRSGPLAAAEIETFTHLRYYPERPDMVFALWPEMIAPPETIEMETSTGQTALYARWARVQFEVDSRPVALTVYRDPMLGHLFLPFQDANAGGETYGAGRYLEPRMLEDGRLQVDFNYAYNPYCAYSDGWSCPVPPAENHLPVAIAAGEMSFAHAADR